MHQQFSLPIGRVRVFLEFFVQNMKASLLQLVDHVPEMFDGDMVIFFTTQNESDWYLPLENWRQYVTGDITEHPVDCTHLEMLSPESIMLYGKQLRLSLEE